ncbi:MAG: hypothetical protein ACRDZ4_10975 [Egibacteraceae bacterium]
MATPDPFVELPFGAAGMVARVNRLLSGPGELLDGRGLTMEDTLVRKEAGATKLDTGGIAGAPNITALFDWNPQSTAAGTGTISTSVGSATVTGVATAFLTEVNVGDSIRIGSETIRVIAVASNTSLTTDATWLTANAGVAYTVVREQRLVSAADDGKIYIEINGNLDNSTPISGLTKSRTPGRFVACGKEAATNPRKLFYFSGRDAVRVLNGSTFAGSTITTPPVDWSGANQPVNGLLYSNRVIGWGNANDPHRIYVGDADNHENFTTASSTDLRVFSSVGDRVWCGLAFNGIVFFWKYPRGIIYLADVSDSPADWCVRLKSSAIGCAPSPYAALSIDDDVLFMAADGSFHLLSAVDAMGGVRASDLSYALGLADWLRTNVNISRLDLVQSAWYQHKKLAIFSVPSTGSLTNNLLLKFDFGGTQGGGLVKFSYSLRDAAGALAVRRDVGTIERPITGEANFVYLQEQAARSKDSAGYVGLFQTPHLDFSHVEGGLRGKKKNFQALEMVMNPVAVGTLTVEIYVDQVLRETLTFDTTVRRSRKLLRCGDGHTLSLKCSNSATNEDFSVLSAIVWLKPGNEDQSRAV